MLISVLYKGKGQLIALVSQYQKSNLITIFVMGVKLGFSPRRKNDKLMWFKKF